MNIPWMVGRNLQHVVGKGGFTRRLDMGQASSKLVVASSVVDEKCVHESSKPGNRSEGEVLVRLYGSYEYSHILEKYNGNCHEIFDKALEQSQYVVNASQGQSPVKFWDVQVVKQVVNGFFWDVRPAANKNTEAVHSTALGVNITIKLCFNLLFVKIIIGV
ncbi:hypothetical protein COLO4_22690 [Corchorus olitorius]|uniref:Uncharacterized protein n=1 Tax=Corchorus olitorius TaxID=93759 RepID=A0A1R3IKK3_9ROSI|nr:hypothetical protein COLO4_22690 [Corchorus olitorius]